MNPMTFTIYIYNVLKQVNPNSGVYQGPEHFSKQWSASADSQQGIGLH